jgi:serine/threonine protein kinase
MNHPNIPKIYEWNREANFVYIIMEYVDGGELLDRLISVK